MFLIAAGRGAAQDLGTATISAFSSGQYGQARELLSPEKISSDHEEFQLLNLLLTSDPGQAETLLQTLLNHDSADDPWQLRWALEAANSAYARGNFEQVLRILQPFDNTTSIELPGQVFLRAGLAFRALAKMQRAREMFASVKPQDSAFPLARFYLGDIALGQGDPELALRYFASSGGTESAAAGQYQALLALGRNQEAAAVLQARDHQKFGGLSWLNIAPEQNFSAMPNDSLSGAAPKTENARFCLQWAAFSDRALALNFVQQHQNEIPDLRIQNDSSQQGPGLFYVRSGSFNNPVDARSQAQAWRKRLQMDVIVKDNR